MGEGLALQHGCLGRAFASGCHGLLAQACAARRKLPMHVGPRSCDSRMYKLRPCPGFGPHMLVPDALHILDHNGLLSWAAGSLLVTCLRDRVKSLPELNESLRGFYSEHKVKYKIGDIRHGNLYEGGNASGLASREICNLRPSTLSRRACGLPPLFPFPTRRAPQERCACRNAGRRGRENPGMGAVAEVRLRAHVCNILAACPGGERGPRGPALVSLTRWGNGVSTTRGVQC
jgi:hypothetical protein